LVSVLLFMPLPLHLRKGRPSRTARLSHQLRLGSQAVLVAQFVKGVHQVIAQLSGRLGVQGFILTDPRRHQLLEVHQDLVRRQEAHPPAVDLFPDPLAEPAVEVGIAV
jgi:hypothetical protein